MRALAESTSVALEDPSDGVDADVVALALSGDRMGAAKLHAERTGAGFAEAQRVVSAL